MQLKRPSIVLSLLLIVLAGCRAERRGTTEQQAEEPKPAAGLVDVPPPAENRTPAVSDAQGVVTLPLRKLPSPFPVGSILLISRDRARTMLAARDRQTEESIATGLHIALNTLEGWKNPISGKTSLRDDALEHGIVVVRDANGKLVCVPNDDGEEYWRAFQKAVNLPPFEGETKTVRLKGGVQLTVMNRTHAVWSGYLLAGAQRFVAVLGEMADMLLQSAGSKSAPPSASRRSSSCWPTARSNGTRVPGSMGRSSSCTHEPTKNPNTPDGIRTRGCSEDFFRLWIESGKSRVRSPL